MLNYPRLMFADSFTGSAGALTSHTPNTGSSWSAQDAAAYTLNGSGFGQCDDAGLSTIGIVLALSTVSYPQNVTISVDVVNTDNGSSGMVFNYVDANNYWRLDVRNGIVEKVSGGTPATQITGAAALSASHKIILTPTAVIWAKNNVIQGLCTRTMPTGTKIGTYCDSIEAGNNGTWDNLRITTP